MHNVRYGRLDATDEEVIQAAKQARVHQTVARLPEGYATTVGERGLMVSGGEKQRLAVARVLLKDPPILFFDEAVRLTSCLQLRFFNLFFYCLDFGFGCLDRERAHAEHRRHSSGEKAYEHLHCSSPSDCR